MSDFPYIVPPPQQVFRYYDPIGSPVQFEMVAPGVSFLINTTSGPTSIWHVSLGAGTVAGFTYPSYTPPGVIGPQPDGLSTVSIIGAAITHIDSVTATSNTDGTGDTFNLVDNLPDANTVLIDSLGQLLTNADVATLYPSNGLGFIGPVNFGLFWGNPDPPAIYVQSVRMTGYRLYTVYNGNPPIDNTGGGSSGLDALNPGFQAQVERSVNFYDDLVEVFLGQRVNLTVESEGSRLGFHSRGHIINRVELEFKSNLVSGVKEETIDWVYTLEKIPGTLLPGAGTSTAAQDALGTGAELPMFVGLGVTGTGIELGGLA